MENTAWLRSPLVVGGLLFVFPPVGIFLMWRYLAWERTTKVRVSYISAAWFVAMLVIGTVKDHERNASNVNDGQARRDQASRPSETKAGTPPATAKQPAPQAAPAPSLGAKLLADQPLLAAPLELGAFKLGTAKRLPAKVAIGFAADYLAPDNKALVVRLNVNQSNVQLVVDKDTKPTRIAQHDGYIIENDDEKTIAIEWLFEGWYVNTSIDYTNPSGKAAAKKILEALAPKVAAAVDLYLIGTPPGENVQKVHLSAVAQVAVAEFVHGLEQDGIPSEIVASAEVSEQSNRVLVVHIGPGWSMASKQERRAAAQALQQRWATLTSPADPDHANVMLVDGQGKTVGGAFGGIVTVE